MERWKGRKIPATIAIEVPSRPTLDLAAFDCGQVSIIIRNRPGGMVGLDDFRRPLVYGLVFTMPYNISSQGISPVEPEE